MRNIIGKKIESVYVKNDGSMLYIVTNHGHYAFLATADCCSHTWISEIDGVEALIGGEVLDVEQIPMEKHDDFDDDKVVKVYGYKIITHLGRAVLAFRNESNGYYGGDLEEVPPSSWPFDNEGKCITQDWTQGETVS